MNTDNLFTRHDTLLGICEGLGQDFGINSNLFRIAFAGVLFFNPVAAIAAYLGIGLLVFATRMLLPARRAAKAVEMPATVEERTAAAPVSHNDTETRERLAA